MKAEFTDFVENTYHQEIEGVSVHDLNELLIEAKNKGGTGNITLVLSKSEKDYISIDYVGKDQIKGVEALLARIRLLHLQVESKQSPFDSGKAKDK